ncbi:MAG TPA: CDP-alcohol phosphatidyltransferase family protein [Thermoplasmata archaeon]|nr:CDP-alcohol phosphatidyltransferase family protein [Thermoplasmata archaeon]
MTDRWRVAANLATLANALLGVGAILYVLAGNKLWAMLLIACALGFDGLDGMFSRRSPNRSPLFGRIADSIADGITFGLAPAFLIAVHTSNTSTWQPFEPYAIALAVAYLAAALVRLTYFTVRAYSRKDFLGVPTPQSALTLIVALLFHDTPAFQSVQPIGVLVGVAVLAILMVVPIPFPKIRRESPLRWPMVATGVAAGLVLVPVQFQPLVGSPLYDLAYAAGLVMLVGVASYYLIGPFTVPRPATPSAPTP